MVKIIANVNKQDVIFSFTLGQSFPERLDGKLVSIEINGKELLRLAEVKDIPICSVETAYLIWHGKHAGRLLKNLREVFGG